MPIIGFSPARSYVIPMLDHYRKRVEGTNIDPRSLLSTDYFNSFNSVVMLFGMLPDMPELLDEIDQWEFQNYKQHFDASGLDFAGLAIEAYAHAPEPLRAQFEKLIDLIRALIEYERGELRVILETGDAGKFAHHARMASGELQRLLDAGSSIVHGRAGALDQKAVDTMF